MAASSASVISRVEPHTEVLPYVAIRIPCLSPPLDHRVRDDTSSSSFATRPRCLPLPVVLLLLCFFLALTGLAIGTGGLNHISRRAVGREVVPDWWADRDRDATRSHTIEEQAAREQHRALQAAERESKRQRQMDREGTSLFSRLALIPVPPLDPHPFSCLLTHEYASLFLFLVRAFVVRPLWHALIWWHLACAVVCVSDILRWRWKLGRPYDPYEGADGTEIPVPSALLLSLHAFGWFVHALLFGWPSVFLLRRQLADKTKEA